jgi:hypothetical protein
MMVLLCIVLGAEAGEMIPITRNNKVHTLTMHKNHFEGYVDVEVNQKTKKMPVNTTYIVYTVPLQVTTESNKKSLVNFMIDTSTSFTYVYCCDSPVVSRDPETGETTSFCVIPKQDKCAKQSCTDPPCENQFSQWNYPPVNSLVPPPKPVKKDDNIIYNSQPYQTQVYRLVNDDFLPNLIGFTTGDPQKNDTEYTTSATNLSMRKSNEEAHNALDIQLNTVYADETQLLGTEGVLGLAYSNFDFSFERYLQNNLYEIKTCTFALDLYSHEQRVLLETEFLAFKNDGDVLYESTFSNKQSSIGDGKLIIGDAIIEYISNYSSIFPSKEILWSERQYGVNTVVESRYRSQKNRYSQAPIMHQFPIYGLSICGGKVDLFSNYTGNWHARITTDILGLGLPTPYYRMIMDGWVKRGKNSNNTKPFSKWTENEKYSLPDLTFTLHQDDNVQLRIPLYSLFEGDEFHLYDVGEIWNLEGIGVLSTDPVIYLGVNVLHQLFTVLDYTNYRVGFIQKKLKSDENMAMIRQLQSIYCADVSIDGECIGDQAYYAPMNTCLQPQCQLYLFQTVDRKKGICKFQASFYFLITFMIGLCLLSEFVLYEFYHRIIQVLYSRAATNNALLAGNM